VAEFVEKPDSETAEQYLASGDYVWNSGMFAFKAQRFLEELEKYNPDMLIACQKSYHAATRDMDFIRLGKSEFSLSPSDSIDYAVMEKTDKALVIPLSAGWNDVGSWSALWQVADKDADNNVSKGDVLALDCSESYIHAEDKMIVAIGINNMVVVETDDVVMVAPKNQVHRVKAVVDQLKAAKRCEVLHHRKVYRPWGYYVSIDSGARFQTKRIVVKPGAKLSLQMHHHRAEHWVVVKGTASVVRGDETLLISENHSTYIPLGTKHSLANAGVIPLEIIEVQSGSYLGEDDIVRYQDDYGRIKKESDD
jgi:mannose-1-phosphate guanylyltransferase/mannose-1-phosphate guanylyltransferase/mannose-6-phosphate isomerase